MAIDPAPSSVATNALQAIPYSALIGGPLDACIKAQATAAMTTWDFIRNVGLQQDPSTGETKAVTVTFQYNRDGQVFNLVVPLLAIVPIPYIAIDKITIDFKANIAASSSTTSEETSSYQAGAEASGSASVGFGPFSLKLNFKGSVSSKKDSKATQESKYSVEYTMDIHVEASQSDMPAGLATVLNILQSSITEAKPSGSLKISPPEIRLNLATPTQSASLQATVLDGQGMKLPNLDVSCGDIPSGVKPPATPIQTNEDGMATFDIALDENALPAPGTYQVKVKTSIDGKDKEMPAKITVVNAG